MWLQISWLILFWGAEISFAYQNVDTYEFEPDCLMISPYYKKILALFVVNFIVKNFKEAKKPFTSEEISSELDMPIRLVREILFELTEGGIVNEVKSGDAKDPSYQPAFDINRLTIKNVLDSLEKKGANSIPVAKKKELEAITKYISDFEKLIEESPSNKLIKDI